MNEKTKKRKNEKTKKQPGNILLLLIFSSALLASTIFSFKGGEHYVRMADGTYGKALVFLATALIGSFAVIELSALLSKYLPDRFAVICFTGSSTLAVFVIHRFILDSLFEFIDYSSGFTFVMISSIVIYMIALFCAWLIQRIAPILVGKSYSTNR